MINKFSNMAGCRINLNESIAFPYTNNKHTEEEIMDTLPFILASKKILSSNRPIQGSEGLLLKFTWNHNRPWIAQTILSKKNTAGGVIVPDIKIYYRGMVI